MPETAPVIFTGNSALRSNKKKIQTYMSYMLSFNNFSYLEHQMFEYSSFCEKYSFTLLKWRKLFLHAIDATSKLLTVNFILSQSQRS